MSRKAIHIILPCLLCMLPVLLCAQSLTRLEYWFDDDFASRRSVSLSGSDATVERSLSTDGLDNGVHKICFRSLRSDGMYTAISSSLFFKQYSDSGETFEYWLDDDYDGRVRMNIADTEEEQELIFDLSDEQQCPFGYHQLHFRVAQAGKGMSATYTTGIWKRQLGTATQLEYWFDNDIKNSKILDGKLASSGDAYIFNTDIDMSALSVGVHLLNYRPCDSKTQLVGMVQSTTIMKVPSGIASQVEYWFDDDMANSKILTGHLSSDEGGYIINADIDVSLLSIGMHRLNYRACDKENNLFGAIISSPVMKVPSGIASQVEYWFDDDMENSKILDGKLASSGDAYVFNNEINAGSLSMGMHRLNYRACDKENNLYGAVISSPIVKLSVGTATALEYWIDDDRTKVHTINGQLASNGKDYIFASDLDLGEVSAGHHRLYCRAVSNSKRTVTAVTMTPIIVKPRYNVEGTEDLKVTQYSIAVDDEKPLMFDVPTPEETVTITYELDARRLLNGFHTLTTKFWNNLGKNVTEQSTFMTISNSIPTAIQYLMAKKVIDEGSVEDAKPDNKLLRAHIAKMAFRGVYSTGDKQVPEKVTSDDFPTVYDDLSVRTANNDYYYQAARALLYLEYGDGITPFDRNRLNFQPDSTIARIDALKVLMETFNIEPDLTGQTNYFPEDDNVVSLATKNPLKMGYIRKAAALGIITTANKEFRPYAECTRGECLLMLYRIMIAVEAGTIEDPDPQKDDYFEPLNTTLNTIALGVSMQMGNFQHYTKTSFALNGTVPLLFAHSYSSYSTTLPVLFYGAKTIDGVEETYQPMGDGWSHNYHTFITLVGKVEDVGSRAIVHWGGGRIDVYKSNGEKFVSESYGVYDDFTMEGSEAVIKSPSQMECRFSNQGGSGASVLYLSSIKDRNGNTMTLNYEDGKRGSKRISSVSDGVRKLTFSYKTGTNLLASVSDPLGRSISFGYAFNSRTGRYQLKTFTDAKGQSTIYYYEDDAKTSSSKLLTKIQLPKGNYIENEYDANRRLSKTVSGVDGVPTSQTSVSVKASYGNATSTKSQVDVVRDTKTSSYKYTFNANNSVTSMTGEENLFVNSTYGSSVHPQLPTAIESNSTNISDVTYDEKGNVTSMTVTGDGTLTVSMTYDDMNNLTSVTDPKGNKITYSYDEKGNLTGVSAPEGVTSSMTVNSKGLPTSVTNAMGVKTTFDYNKYGNLTTTTVPALSLSSSVSYDEASRLTSTTDALGRTSSFVYDNNDNLTSETDPAGHVTSYGFDANDNMVRITNAMGGVTTMTYDNATDWLTSVEFAEATKQYTYHKDGTLDTYTKPDGTKLTYSYDGLGRVTSDGINDYTYDNKMRLSSVSGSGKTMTFSYDGFNRITGTSYDGHSNSYTYDENSNCTSINNTTYGYDRLNRLTSVTFKGKTITYTYRKDSQLSTVSYPNGMTTVYGYDAVGRLTSKSTKLSNGKVIAAYTYTLDKVGNITEQTTREPYGGMLLEDEEISYTYNSGNRITKAGDIDFEFDANGNTTKRGNELYKWDKRDRLTRAGGTDIGYDPLGLIASYGNIKFTTDPLGIGNVLSDSKSGAEYIYGKGLEARIVNDKISYYVTDVRGSVVAIVDEDGKITHKYQYDEFGKVTQKYEADFNPFQYVGKYGVMALNDHQYYMRARHYDPTIGRFLSEDPIWSTNLYPYVSNNPITFIDPEGELLQYSYNGSSGWVKNGVIHYDSDNKKNNKKIKEKLEEAMKYQTDGKYFYENGKRKYWTDRYVFLGGISDEAKTILLNNYSQYGDDTYWLPEYTKNNNDIFIDNVVGKDSPYTYWGNATKSCFNNSKECLGW